MDSGSTNGLFIEEGFTPKGSIDDEMDLAALDVIDDVRTAFVHFVDRLRVDSGVSQDLSRPPSSDDFEADLGQLDSYS